MNLKVKAFKKIRLEAKITQVMLAKKLNKKPQYISNIEGGRAPLPAEIAVKMLAMIKDKKKRREKTIELMLAFKADHDALLQQEGLS